VKFKLVPAPPAEPGAEDASARAVEFVAAAQRAVPLVPDSEDDCCERLMSRLGLRSRDVARTWLTFLRALRLAEETDRGFKRVRTEPTPERLREAFRERVFGAEELLSVLADDDGPLSADAAFERFRERVPVWEHHKNPTGWETTWAERVERILDWLALLDLAERSDDGYLARDV
jgi:hypothetical protein